LLKHQHIFVDRRNQILFKNTIQNNITQKNNFNTVNKYNYNDFIEITRFSKKNQGSNNPVRLIKYPISNKTSFNYESNTVEIFKLRFNDNNTSINQKPLSHSTFLTLKQKRYKRKKVVLPRTIFYKDMNGDKTKKIKYSAYPYLHQNKIILNDFENATRQYRMMRKNKIREELTNLTLSKRMLRTRRTLVLPAHVNITAITNSYDVIHS